jgi:hypothetical protein
MAAGFEPFIVDSSRTASLCAKKDASKTRRTGAEACLGTEKKKVRKGFGRFELP